MSFRELEEFVAIVLLEELDFAMELLLDPITSLQDDEGAELLLEEGSSISITLIVTSVMAL